jgi:DNA-binding MarR family transcriptional regulator
VAATPRRPGRDDDADWLTDQEQAAWTEVRRLLLVLPSVLDSRTSQQTGLSFFEYQIMASLSDGVDRSLRMSELAAATSSSLSRLSHAVTRLESKGIVVRRRCGGVGRSSVASLTPQGYGKLVASAPNHVASVRTLVVGALSIDELQSLAANARRILERLDADDPEA